MPAGRPKGSLNIGAKHHDLLTDPLDASQYLNGIIGRLVTQMAPLEINLQLGHYDGRSFACARVLNGIACLRDAIEGYKHGAIVHDD